MIRWLSILAGLFAVAGSMPAQAAPAPVAVPMILAVSADDAPYADVINAISEGVDQDRMYDNLAGTIAQQLASANPTLIEAEAQYPGLSAALARAIKPAMVAYGKRVRNDFNPSLIAVLKQQITPAEARDVAAFYRLPIGRKLMGGVQTSYAGTATIGDAVKGGDVTQAAVTADTNVAVRGALAQLTPADFTELSRLAMQTPALLKLKQIAEAIRPIRLAMENAPLTKSEDAEIERLTIAAVKDHIARAKH